LRAEQELAELRKQLEFLNNLIIQNSCTNRSDENVDELNHIIEELSEVRFQYKLVKFYFKLKHLSCFKEKDALCVLLKEKDDELTEMKQKLTQLQSEYIKDVRNGKDNLSFRVIFFFLI
jgi:hypothetical protein